MPVNERQASTFSRKSPEQSGHLKDRKPSASVGTDSVAVNESDMLSDPIRSEVPDG